MNFFFFWWLFNNHDYLHHNLYLRISYCFRNNIRASVCLSLPPSCLSCMLSCSLTRLWNPQYIVISSWSNQQSTHTHTNIHIHMQVHFGIFVFLVVFIFFCGTSFCYLCPSAEIQLFCISYSTNLLEVNSFSFCLSEKMFILYSFKKDIFTKYRVLGW